MSYDSCIPVVPEFFVAAYSCILLEWLVQVFWLPPLGSGTLPVIGTRFLEAKNLLLFLFLFLFLLGGLL